MSELHSKELLAKLHDLHAPIRVPGIGEYQYACGEAAQEIERLRFILNSIGGCISGHDGIVFDDIHDLLEAVNG
jgi:hypothetical protein